MPDAQYVPILLERLARILHNDAHAEGLKPAQWEALRFLSRANRFSRSPTALTAYFGTTKGTVSQTLQAIERKGLIEKIADGDDGRALRLDVTSSGRSMLRKDPIRQINSAVERIADLPSADISSGLEKIVASLINVRDGKPFGICSKCRHFRTDDPKGKPNYCSLLSVPLSRVDAGQICIEQTAA